MADATYVPTRPQRAQANLSAVPYLPGLDGMRAIAVVAVMLYHANHDWLPGGFLGVEVFFVISGYLITLLLMDEREKTGGIKLLAFWGRRARRLLPALFVMMFLVLTYSMIFKSSVLGKLRGDLVAGLFYVSNWYQIWVGQGYTAGNDFVPLRHLWSLAVEEQFYLFWPIIMLLLMRRHGTRRLAMTARWLVGVALGDHVVHGDRVPRRPDRRVLGDARRLLDRRWPLRLEDGRPLPVDDHALDRRAAGRRVRDGVATAGDHAQPAARPLPVCSTSSPSSAWRSSDSSSGTCRSPTTRARPTPGSSAAASSSPRSRR